VKDLPNVFEQKVEEKPVEQRKPLHQSDFTANIIKPQHIQGEVITRGLAANKPNGTTPVKVYFETDTGVLSIWDGSAWLSTTLS